jgi:hypothetical protein
MKEEVGSRGNYAVAQPLAIAHAPIVNTMPRKSHASCRSLIRQPSRVAQYTSRHNRCICKFIKSNSIFIFNIENSHSYMNT